MKRSCGNSCLHLCIIISSFLPGGANALKGQFTLEYLLIREIMTHSKLKIVDWVQNNNTFGAPPGFGFYSLQQGCFRAQPTQAKKKKRLWMENLTWQKWIMLAKNGKEFVLFFGGPHLFKDGRQWEPIFSESRIYSLLIIIVVLCLFSLLKMWSWRKLVKMGNVPWSPQNNEWTLGITVTPGMLTNIPPNKCGTINWNYYIQLFFPHWFGFVFLGLPKRWCCTHKTIRYLLTIIESPVLCLWENQVWITYNQPWISSEVNNTLKKLPLRRRRSKREEGKSSSLCPHQKHTQTDPILDEEHKILCRFVGQYNGFGSSICADWQKAWHWLTLVNRFVTLIDWSKWCVMKSSSICLVLVPVSCWWGGWGIFPKQ